MRILIAEDEVTIARALKVMLEKNKYAVDLVHNGNDALDYLRATGYDALVLDIMMPGKDGSQVLKTAGLDAGADDYLPKPFAASEFLARVRALVRRSSVYAPALLTVGNTTLDGDQYMLKAPADTVRLNNKEYQLTELFFRHPRQVFSSAHLFEKIWGLDSQAEMDVVWTYISFLRRKLKQIGADVEIRTIRGAGYALEEMPC